MIRALETVAPSYDLIVIGAGAAGMAAALFGRIRGLSVLLVERTAYLGGTSALSAATTWIPNSDHAATVAGDDSPQRAERFLSAVVGNHAERAMHRAFLEAGPKAIRLLEAESKVRFRPYALHPDYEQEHDGATLRSRALELLPFDGRTLGAALDCIRPPIPEFTLFGGMMVDRTDIGHLLRCRSNAASFRHALAILGRYGLERLAGRKRGSRLVMGNALIGRMLGSLLDRKADIVLGTEVLALHQRDGRVTGVALGRPGMIDTGETTVGGIHEITTRAGVVLAAGGFNRDPALRAQFLPGDLAPYSPSAPGHTGAMQKLACRLGARYGQGALDSAFWAPVSVRQRPDGSTAVFPHFVLDRSKPGTICVNREGRRFTNESASYHRFGRAMIAGEKASKDERTGKTAPCFILADARALNAYGLGMVRMGTRRLAPFLADGYLTEAATLAELARKLAMDPAVLEETVRRFNGFAETGIDPDFGRGTTAYHRANGDTAYPGPNPTLGRIETAPFYAVKLWPGDIGAATGLAISPDAEVLGAGDTPIAGLYACGNEAQSIMGGTYPGPGITIGPAITFAYRAVEHARQAISAAPDPGPAS